MSKTHIPDALRLRVTQAFRHRCSYCQTSERVIGAELTVDHIVPEVLGGETIFRNLCLACWKCNLHKADLITALDPVTRTMVRLFHPHEQDWHEHFIWQSQGLLIMGSTACGRATVNALQLNRTALVRSRELWIEAGWHPPKD